MKFSARFFFLFSFLLLAACVERVQPIYNPSNIAIPSALYSASLSDIGKAIFAAGESENWKMEKVKEGRIRATLNVRTHQAVADIIFSRTAYSIVYVSSIHLLADGTGIHHNYNIWVGQLQTAIDTRFRELALKAPKEPDSPLGKAEAEWGKLKDSRDLVALLNFAEKNQDNPYGKFARQRLNMLMNNGPASSFDPTGKWRVSATYIGDKGNPADCPGKTNWSFILNIRQGKFSETFWSDQDPLYVKGENTSENITFYADFPNGGAVWKWAEKFKLDAPEKRFQEHATMGVGYGDCRGTIGVYMKSLEPHEDWVPQKEGQSVTKPAPTQKKNEGPATGTAPQKPASPDNPADAEARAVWDLVKDSGSIEMLRDFLKDYSDSKYASKAIDRLNSLLAKADTPKVFSAVGNWTVTASYKGDKGNIAWCPVINRWTFPLKITKGKFSEEAWDGSVALYLNGRVTDGVTKLRLDMPKGGTSWEWSENNILDGPRKTFTVTAKEPGNSFGSCVGKIVLSMTKR